MTTDDVIRLFQRAASSYAQAEELPIQVNPSLMVSTREIHTIEAIGAKKLENVTSVAKQFGITKSAASQLVTKLEKKGLLKKLPSPTSGKELYLTLTELGWEASRQHEALHGKHRNALAQHLDGLPSEQLRAFCDITERFQHVIDARLAIEK